MQFLNKNPDVKKRIAYLSALTLLFSYAEMLLPRIIPFFRLGLSNTVILLAFNLPISSFLLLTVLKAVCSCLMAGTLFSPFMFISVFQSVFSGILMYALFYANKACKEKLFSVYGISVLGSSLSAVLQIFLSRFYLGKGTESLLGPMLIFNCLSGIFTAFLSQKLKIPQESPKILEEESSEDSKDSRPSQNPHKEESSLDFVRKNNFTINKFHQNKKSVFFTIFIICFSVSVFFIKNIFILCEAFFVSLILQKLRGRKIFILPHISLWIFVIISSLFVPNGKVLFKIFDFSVTQGSLFLGLDKALKLSTVSALSQCLASLRPSSNSLIGKVLLYYKKLLDYFRSTKGNLLKRISLTLSTKEL